MIKRQFQKGTRENYYFLFTFFKSRQYLDDRDNYAVKSATYCTLLDSVRTARPNFYFLVQYLNNSTPEINTYSNLLDCLSNAFNHTDTEGKISSYAERSNPYIMIEI